MTREARRHPDGPSSWQSDPFRILYSPEFRRLASVTQVAVSEGGLLFHNRLTHSLKVAEIALRLAQRLRDEFPNLVEAHGGIDLDVVKSAALAHDLGHPPFGHVAERKLDKLLTDNHHVMDGFEGNPQSFRIVAKIAVHTDRHDGLNLSRATLCAILKYPWHRQTTGPQQKKWGAYHSEAEDFAFARELHKGGKDELCVEAQIMTWADDITYSVHDIEDFYQAGLVPLDRLHSGPEADRFLTGVFERRTRERVPSKYTQSDLETAFRGLFRLATVSQPYTGARRQQAALKEFSQGLIQQYVSGTSLGEPGSPGGALLRDERILMEVEMLKELLWFYVIKNPALATQEYGQGQIVERLFDIFADVVSKNDPDRWNILPGRARELMREVFAEHGSDPPAEHRLRVVADTIAGMTEQQALLIFHRLTGVSPGSLFQPVVL
jgi:dGTPase